MESSSSASLNKRTSQSKQSTSAAMSVPLNVVEEKLSPIVEKLTPLFNVLGNIFNTVEPYVEKAYQAMLELWKKLEPYHPEELVDVVFGLFLVFFGGLYLTLLATVEAYRMCGWTQTKGYLNDLYTDYLAVRNESLKDDLLDENKDGIADVKQITKKQLATRKLKLVLKSCNPEKVIGALSGLYMGFLAVMATLRIQFAQAVTLGATIGDLFYKTADRYITPLLTKFVVHDYQKWIPVVLKYVSRSIAISIAWYIQRVISAFYSAFRGANLFARGVLEFSGRNGYTSPFDESSIIFTAVTTVVGLVGFYWQVTSGFSLPFPLNLIMLPFTMLEYFLTWMVNSVGDVVQNTVASAA